MSGKLPPAGNVKAKHRFQLFGTTPTNHKQAGRTAYYASIALTREGRIKYGSSVVYNETVVLLLSYSPLKGAYSCQISFASLENQLLTWQTTQVLWTYWLAGELVELT